MSEPDDLVADIRNAVANRALFATSEFANRFFLELERCFAIERDRSWWWESLQEPEESYSYDTHTNEILIWHRKDDNSWSAGGPQ